MILAMHKPIGSSLENLAEKIEPHGSILSEYHYRLYPTPKHSISNNLKGLRKI